MSWFNTNIIYCLILLVLVLIIAFQQITHSRTVVLLIDRVIAKNYGELVQGQVLLTKEEQSKAIKIVLPEIDNDPNGVDMLNKIL